MVQSPTKNNFKSINMTNSVDFQSCIKNNAFNFNEKQNSPSNYYFFV